jgi:hypothetical protein
MQASQKLNAARMERAPDENLGSAAGVPLLALHLVQQI